MAKKQQKKWHRAHFFKRKKSKKTVGHPVYVYGVSRGNYKYLTFTHQPETEKDYVKLKHNIDPDMDGKEPTYMRTQYRVTHQSAFRDPDKKYYIHDDDRELVKRYKK